MPPLIESICRRGQAPSSLVLSHIVIDSFGVNICDLCAFCGSIHRSMIGAYEAAYRAWQQDPEGFWAQAAESIHWYRRWDHVLDTARAPFYRWFSGGLVNTCYNLQLPPTIRSKRISHVVFGRRAL